MKKFSFKIFFFAAALLMLIIPAFATETDLAQDDKFIQSEIEKAIVLFYENKDIGTNNNFSGMMNTDVVAYLNNKVYEQQRATQLYSTNKENYAVQVKLIDKEAANNKIEFKFQVITTYNYTNSKDDGTTVSEEVIIIFDCKSGLITDFYSPVNSETCQAPKDNDGARVLRKR